MKKELIALLKEDSTVITQFSGENGTYAFLAVKDYGDNHKALSESLIYSAGISFQDAQNIAALTEQELKIAKLTALYKKKQEEVVALEAEIAELNDLP